MSSDLNQTDERYDLQALLDLMIRLRDPVNGCPWDCAQDFNTIAPYTVEEAYEVADAIARGDLNDLVGELGDLLFQVVFHSRMAEELGSFDFHDVVHGIVQKMRDRHPHVFAPMASDRHCDTSADTERAHPDAIHLDRSWESRKAEERRRKGFTSAMDDIPGGLAPLQRAGKLQKRAAAQGFDWHGLSPVIDKLHEELRELEQAQACEQESARRAALLHEVGDVLFTCVNLARKLEVDPETALLGANTRFEARFRTMENTAQGNGTHLAVLNDEEREALWEAAKDLE